MRTLSKYAAAATLAGALALAAATPSQARWYGHGWHHGPGAAIGFGAGALVGAAAASAAYPPYYGYDYYGPAYAYAPDSYAAGPYDSYAYAPPYGEYWSRANSHRGPRMRAVASVDPLHVLRLTLDGDPKRGGLSSPPFFYLSSRARRSSAPCRI